MIEGSKWFFIILVSMRVFFLFGRRDEWIHNLLDLGKSDGLV